MYVYIITEYWQVCVVLFFNCLNVTKAIFNDVKLRRRKTDRRFLVTSLMLPDIKGKDFLSITVLKLIWHALLFLFIYLFIYFFIFAFLHGAIET